MYSQFARDVNAKTDRQDRWLWIGRSNLKLEAEILISAVQELALRTNYMRCRIDNTINNDKCKMCSKRDERVFAHRWRKPGFGTTRIQTTQWQCGKNDSLDLCGNQGLQRTKAWYEWTSKWVTENEKRKILWDVIIRCNHMTRHSKPHIMYDYRHCIPQW